LGVLGAEPDVGDRRSVTRVAASLVLELQAIEFDDSPKLVLNMFALKIYSAPRSEHAHKTQYNPCYCQEREE
jgi:hypothetical protein